MTDSLLSHRSETKSNRLDPPHDLMMVSSEDPTTPWMALAGRDPSSSSDQLDRQTSELLAYVQQQNDEIDQRQAELNAKLAQLDNELRTARLRTGSEIGEDLLAPQATKNSLMDSGIALDELPATPPTETESTPPHPTPVTAPPSKPERNEDGAEFQEFEEVERLVAQISDVAVAVPVAKLVESTPSKPSASVLGATSTAAADDKGAGNDGAASERTTSDRAGENLVKRDQVAPDTSEPLASSSTASSSNASSSTAFNSTASDSVIETQASVSKQQDPALAESAPGEPETEFIDERIERRLSDEKTKIIKQTTIRRDSSHSIDRDGFTAKRGVNVQVRAEPYSGNESTAAPTSGIADSETLSKASSGVDSFPQLLGESHLSRHDGGVDLQAMATSLDASELESERRLLAERKIELDRRKSVLQRMQDETQALHREALEMRLVTEQLWIEISGKAPDDHVNELLTSLRSRLDEHYHQQQETIDDGKTELDELKQLIQQKQEDLRQQSNQLQEWVQTRHDEIKSHAAEVDAREMLLDRREHRMREEFSKWEATRAAYQKQLQGLLKKLDISSLAGI